MKTPRILDLGFAIIEGVVLKEDQLTMLFDVFNEYYKEHPFVSIANREHDYTIDPNLLKTKKHPYNESSKEIAKFERNFYTGKYEIFQSMEEAVHWANKLLNEYIKKAGL